MVQRAGVTSNTGVSAVATTATCLPPTFVGGGGACGSFTEISTSHGIWQPRHCSHYQTMFTLYINDHHIKSLPKKYPTNRQFNPSYIVIFFFCIIYLCFNTLFYKCSSFCLSDCCWSHVWNKHHCHCHCHQTPFTLYTTICCCYVYEKAECTDKTKFWPVFLRVFVCDSYVHNESQPLVRS